MTAKPDAAFERLTPELRSKQILAAALKLSRRYGYRKLTRDKVAKEAKAAQGLVNLYFGNMDGLRDAVMRRAVEENDAKLVAQGIAERNRVALDAPADLRKRAVTALAS